MYRTVTVMYLQQEACQNCSKRLRFVWSLWICEILDVFVLALAEGRRALVAEPWPRSLAGTAEPAGWPQLGELQGLSGAGGGVVIPLENTSQYQLYPTREELAAGNNNKSVPLENSAR